MTTLTAKDMAEAYVQAIDLASWSPREPCALCRAVAPRHQHRVIVSVAGWHEHLKGDLHRAHESVVAKVARGLMPLIGSWAPLAKKHGITYERSHDRSPELHRWITVEDARTLEQVPPSTSPRREKKCTYELLYGALAHDVRNVPVAWRTFVAKYDMVDVAPLDGRRPYHWRDVIVAGYVAPTHLLNALVVASSGKPWRRRSRPNGAAWTESSQDA